MQQCDTKVGDKINNLALFRNAKIIPKKEELNSIGTKFFIVILDPARKTLLA